MRKRAIDDAEFLNGINRMMAEMVYFPGFGCENIFIFLLASFRKKKPTKDMFWAEERDAFATVYVTGLDASQYVYLEMGGKIFDLKPQEDGSFAAAVDKEELNLEKVSVTTIAKENPKKRVVYK